MRAPSLATQAQVPSIILGVWRMHVASEMTFSILRCMCYARHCAGRKSAWRRAYLVRSYVHASRKTVRASRHLFSVVVQRFGLKFATFNISVPLHMLKKRFSNTLKYISLALQLIAYSLKIYISKTIYFCSQYFVLSSAPFFSIGTPVSLFKYNIIIYAFHAASNVVPPRSACACAAKSTGAHSFLLGSHNSC